jgi:23S rRNA (guanosine2251-2'-O)-methyltransferase
MANRPTRAGAVRKTGKGPTVGTGGHGRKALEGRGPTPKAEDRTYHPAGKRKASAERFERAAEKGRPVRAPELRGNSRVKASSDGGELVAGRNSVLEALRAKIPATALYVAARVEMDDRVREIISIANKRALPVMEIMRPELERMVGSDTVHQGVAIKVPAYEYAHPRDLLDAAIAAGVTPLLVALDGVTDPRNLGAIIRSTAAFGGNGVIVPSRRSVGVTAAAWKTSAGAAARCRVAMATNLAAAITELKKAGVFVIGLDGGGTTLLPNLDLADRPLLIVVGSEGSGLSRLVTEKCDAIVSIPISAATESLNAGIAASVALYEVARVRTPR